MLKGHKISIFIRRNNTYNSAELGGMRKMRSQVFYSYSPVRIFLFIINFTANVYKVLIEYNGSIFGILNSLAILN